MSGFTETGNDAGVLEASPRVEELSEEVEQLAVSSSSLTSSARFQSQVYRILCNHAAYMTLSLVRDRPVNSRPEPSVHYSRGQSVTPLYRIFFQ